MKTLIFNLFFGLTIMSFCSCSSDGDTYAVEIDKSEIILSNTQTKQELQVISSGSWGIDAEGLERFLGTPRAETDWYIIDIASGIESTKITIELKGNPTAQKQATIKVVGDHNSQTLTLKYFPNP